MMLEIRLVHLEHHSLHWQADRSPVDDVAGFSDELRSWKVFQVALVYTTEADLVNN